MSDVRVIVPEDLKASVSAILQTQDLTVSQAVRLFFREVVNHGGLPFPSDRSHPNAATLAAMKVSMDSDSLTTFDTVDEIFASWDRDK